MAKEKQEYDIGHELGELTANSKSMKESIIRIEDFLLKNGLLEDVAGLKVAKEESKDSIKWLQRFLLGILGCILVGVFFK